MRNYPRDLQELALAVGRPGLPSLIRRFLYDQEYPNADIPGSEVDISLCPEAPARVTLYPSAIATFYAPSDTSGSGGMKRERIRSVPSWRRGPPRRDCVFVNNDPTSPGFRGLHAARVMLFFSFKYGPRIEFPCALVTWFSVTDDEPCPNTGMWIVAPDVDRVGERVEEVIHLDAIVRGAHLLGVAGSDFIPDTLHHTDTLDAFEAFYVNKYVDHHAHEIAF